MLLGFECVVFVLTEESAIAADLYLIHHADYVLGLVVQGAEGLVVVQEHVALYRTGAQQKIITFIDDTDVNTQQRLLKVFSCWRCHCSFSIDGKAFRLSLYGTPCIATITNLLVDNDFPALNVRTLLFQHWQRCRNIFFLFLLRF